jgi:hypothetical protein
MEKPILEDVGDSTCKRVLENYVTTEWNELDILTRKMISDCAVKEIKTIVYGWHNSVDIPRDLFTNEGRMDSVLNVFITSVKGICTSILSEEKPLIVSSTENE